MTAQDVVEAYLSELRSNLELLEPVRNVPLPRAYRARTKGIAGFRNVLVHAYVRLDSRLVHEHLRRLDDLREFGRHVEVFMQRES